MIVLGLNDAFSAAAIIKDGKLLAAVREERFNRIKHCDDFPAQSMQYCLKEAGVSIKEVDRIVFAWNPGHEIEPFDTSASMRYHKDFLHYVPNNVLNAVSGRKENKRIKSIHQHLELFEGNIEISFVPHHFSHASAAFFTSPFEKAAILTTDAYGDDISVQMFTGKGNHIEVIQTTYYPHSLGSVFAAVTQYLGFRANSDEWKVMGLAPFGEPTYYDAFSNIIKFLPDEGRLWIDLDYFTYYIWSPRRYSDKFEKVFGPERHYSDELTKKHEDIACSFQKRVEAVVLEMLSYLYERTKVETLCLSGGCSMNSKMNGRIVKDSPFSKVFIQSSADDGGACLGACFYWWNQVLQKKRSFVMDHDYWGPGFTNDEIEKVLKDALVPYKKYDNIERVAAQAISEGNIVGWFQGRMEYGQRALGNRSLLADPRDPAMKDKINSRVKHREKFRPFAPSILDDYQSEFFDEAQQAPFMQKVYSIKKEKHSLVPAVTHVDGTGRLQTVSKGSNPRYYELINQFSDITGIPIVLNTSFNDNNEPIVCTPKDALRCFFSTGIDILFMGDFMIKK